MAKALKTVYQCSECGGTVPKWQGKCPHCGEWNTLQEQLAAPEPKNARFQSWAADSSQVQELSQVTATEVPRTPTGMSELDRVLGGGLVDGAVILLGGCKWWRCWRGSRKCCMYRVRNRRNRWPCAPSASVCPPRA